MGIGGRSLRGRTNGVITLKNLNRQNYPPLLVLWLLVGSASTLIGAFTNDMILLGGGAGVMLLEALYVSTMPKPPKGMLTN